MRRDAASEVELPLVSPSTSPRRVSCLFAAFRWMWNSCTCCALMGAVCASSNVVAIKALTKDDISVFQLSLFRSFIGLPLIVSVGYRQSTQVTGPWDRNTKWILLLALCGSLQFLVSNVAIALIPVSEVALFVNSYPAVFALMLWMFNIEKIDRLSCIGIFGTFAGNVLIVRPPFLFGDAGDWDLERGLGIFFAFLALLIMTSGFVVVWAIDKTVSSVVFANHIAVQTILYSIPFVVLEFPEENEWRPSLKHLCLYVVSGLALFNQVFLNRAFQIGPPIKAGMITLSRMLMVVGASAALLSEEITLSVALGAGLILCSIALVIWSRSRRSAEADKQLDVRVDGRIREAEAGTLLEKAGPSG